jgi:hypothetical protein
LDEKEKVIKKDNLNFYFFASVQSDLTEAFARLNQTPLALFRDDKNPNKDFFYICITGTYFILLPFILPYQK